MGRVLKAPAHNRVPKVLADGNARAEAIVDEAHQRAAQMLEAALARATEIEERAAAAAAHRYRSLAARAEAELDHLSAAREGALLRLAIGVAEKVVARALTLDSSLVVDMVREAVSKLPRATSFVVRAHPDSGPHVAREFPTFVIKSDESLAPGDVIVESEIGRVDARVAVRLETVRRVLEDDASSERRGGSQGVL
jgi:flagellar biosynthesis/type III secretory pathway protein FliH